MGVIIPFTSSRRQVARALVLDALGVEPPYRASPEAIERTAKRLQRMLADYEALPSTAALTEHLTRFLEENG